MKSISAILLTVFVVAANCAIYDYSNHHRRARSPQFGLAHPSYAGSRPNPQNVNVRQSSQGQMVPGILYSVPAQTFQNRFDGFGFGQPYQQFPNFQNFGFYR